MFVVDQVHDALRRRDHVDAQRFGHMRAQRGLGGVPGPARPRRPAARAGCGPAPGSHPRRSGACPRARSRRGRGSAPALSGTDADRALIRHRRDRPATGADRVNVDDRERQRVLADPPGRARAGSPPWISATSAEVPPMSMVRRSSIPASRPSAGGSARPGGGTRERQVDGAARRLVRRAHAAVRLHDEERRADATLRATRCESCPT